VNPDSLCQVQPLEPMTSEEEFEKLRQSFRQRLWKEHAGLSALTEVLVRTETASASLFVDLRAFAHRLRGAALVFGFQDIGDCAKAVELAAISASLDLSRQQFDLSVVSTMEALAISLVIEIGSGAPPVPLMPDSTGTSNGVTGNP
jgi:Hpt domain